MRTVFRIAMAVLMSGILMGGVGALILAQAANVSSGAYTSQQASRGKTAYTGSCAACHLEDLSGDAFATPLIGETFKQRWQDSNVGELFTVVKATMPATKPGSLTDEMYADIIAYLLMMNNYPPGAQELGKDADTLSKITFKNP